MPAELRKGQVRARRDETHAFGDFFRAYGTEEFPVERQAARGIHDLHFTAPAGNLEVALGVGNLDAASTKFHIYVGASIEHFNIAASGGDAQVAAGARGMHVPLLVADGQ